MTSRFSILGLLLAALLASCANPSPPRRDLILILQERAPSPGAAPAFDRLSERALLIEGPLRRVDSPLETPIELGLRVEIFTGRYEPKYREQVWPELPSLPEAARLSGRRALGFTTHGGITTEAGFDEFVAPGKSGGLIFSKTSAAQAEDLVTAFRALTTEYETSGIERARIFLFCDLGSGANASDLQRVLHNLESLGLTASADLALYFTAPDSSMRLLLSSNSLRPSKRLEAVDPRDLYPTLAHLGRIPPPGVLQGHKVLDLTIR